jgi:hypothetical protein
VGGGARRSHGHRAGRAGVLIAALLAVGGLLIALATHRDGAPANPNSAIFVSVPPLTGPASTDATVPPFISAAPGADRPGPTEGGGLDTNPLTVEDDPATAAPWPAPPADPSAAVDAALADAAGDGVRMGVLVVDRSTGAVLVARDADTTYPSLSLIKVMIAADVLTTGWPGSTGWAADLGSGPARSTSVPSTPGAVPDDLVTEDSPPSAEEPTDGSLPVLTDPTQIDAVLTRMIATSDDVIASDLYDATGGDEMVQRVAARYGMTDTTPAPDGTYWGDVQVTAIDLAALLSGVLADPRTAAVIDPAMRATTAIAADGVDQRFGMRLVPGAGSKQGWGCCLSGIAGLHSMGFTADRIVVVLSGGEPDDDSLGEQDGLALQSDPGARAGRLAVDDVVRAALGGPAG